jgi:hypothetical protein
MKIFREIEMASEPGKTNSPAETHSMAAAEGEPTDLVNASTSAAGPQETEEKSHTGASWVRICPKCSVQSTVSGGFCPACGTSYTRRRKFPRISKKAAVITLAIIVVGGAAAGTALGVQHSQEVAAEEAAAKKARAAAAAVAAEKARELEAAEAEEKAERAIRAIIVTGLEEAVQKDAVSRVDEGRLDGPIQRTECTPLGGGSVDDLTAITGTFECIAVNEKRDDGSESGYVFSATVNWDAASYSWHLGR